MSSSNSIQKAAAAARTAAGSTSTRNQVIIDRQASQTATTRPGGRVNANGDKINRGYSKSTNNTNANATANIYSSQSQQASAVTAATTQLPLNAPTSLANLAQLDGITLLPIGNLNSAAGLRQQQKNLSSNIKTSVSIQTAAAQGTSSPISSSSSSASSGSSSSSGATNNNTNYKPRQHRQPSLKISGQSTKQQQLPTRSITTNNSQDQMIYNLASIPSIQMLNQTSSVDPIIQNHSWRNLTTVNAPKGIISGASDSGQMVKLSAQMQSSANKASCTTSQNKGRANNNSRAKSTSNINNNNLNNSQSINDIQVIPLTETLPIFSDVSEIQPSQSCNSSFGEFLSQLSLKSTSDESCVDINGDMNNISLIKLMAILNNPALTITAVDSRTTDINNGSNNGKPSHGFPTTSSNMDDRQFAQVVRTNLLDNQQLSISIPAVAGNLDDSFNSRNDCITTNTIRNQNLHADLPIRNRIPQSTANLQVIDSALANCSSIQSSKRHNHSSTGLRNINSIGASKESSGSSQSHSSHNGPSNSQANCWLSSCTSSDTISSFNQQPTSSSISWSNVSHDEGNLFPAEKLNDPTMLSTSVRNLMMQQLPAGTKQQTVSVQLLKHIANQTKDNDTWTSVAGQPSHQKSSILEPECVLNVPRSVQQFNLGAKRMESFQTVTTSSISKKRPKQPIQSTKDRLYVPRPDDSPVITKKRKIVSGPNFGLNEINIDGCDEREVHVSEQHLILESMMSNETGGEKQKNAMPEPDDIFINRSKRVMSKIDTIIERKKRRRFERISGRAALKTNSLEEQCAESEDEWSGDENTDVDYTCFIRTQLPLEEFETKEKRNHLLSVGLVSRNERNRLSVEHYEKKLKVFSPLALEEPSGVPQDIQRFVDTLLKTGGTDIQLRIDSSIKRNDLPLIEGLNRNTSRMKMTYMNVLGLEKRSKRTTLYKVKTAENNNGAMPKLVDLIKAKSATFDEPRIVELEARAQVTVDRTIGHNAILAPKITAATFTSCREAMKPPSKNEYMKSLGLACL